MIRLLFRVLTLLALAGLMFYLFQMAQISQAGESPDGTKLITFYAAILIDGLAMAALLSTWLLPLLGDFIGGFLYTPETVEQHPHATAMARIAAGDYAAAIEAYRERLQESPEDILAVHEAVRLYVDKLHDAPGAVGFLEEMLEYGAWNDYQRSLLFERLEEIRHTLDAHDAHDSHDPQG